MHDNIEIEIKIEDNSAVLQISNIKLIRKLMYVDVPIAIQARNHCISLVKNTKRNSNRTIMIGYDFNAEHIDQENYTINPTVNNRAIYKKQQQIRADNDFIQHQMDSTGLDIFYTNQPKIV